jgi:membrane protein implicated in regulation of membrane protease activity
MFSPQIIAGTIYRIFLLSLIVAVLWVKGYLWWIFGIAVVLFIIHVFANLPLGRRVQNEDDDDPDEDDDEELDAENNGEDKPPF